jgi:predicted nucleotidyltransferase
LQIVIDQNKIESFCRLHHIQQLALFGSILREDFSSAGDVDLLAEFEPGHRPGLAFFAMQKELSSILDRKVDLNRARFLSPYFREHVPAEAEVQYVALLGADHIAWKKGQSLRGRSNKDHLETSMIMQEESFFALHQISPRLGTDRPKVMGIRN